ncbi:MAG: porin [Marinagarivorans sp.]|nr:porin [Marinagarivorans sp.]
MGLENQLSLRHQPLLERSTPTQAFLFGRNEGVAVAVEYDTWTLNLALTEREAESERYDDSYAKILRATYAPLHTKKKFIHLGFDYSTRKGIEDQYDINEPVLAAGLDNLIHSPNFAAEKINLMGLEFAARYHHLLLQSEYFEQTIKREAIVDQSMNGYYLMAVYTLLGDERGYKNGKLKFSKKNTHTLEIATRYSNIELTPIFQGDDADIRSITLNYYYQKYLRLSLEYQDVEVLSSGRKNSKELYGESIAGRIQLAF